MLNLFSRNKNSRFVVEVRNDVALDFAQDLERNENVLSLKFRFKRIKG